MSIIKMHQHTLVNKNTKEFNFIDNINFLIEKNKININQLSKTIDTSFMTLNVITCRYCKLFQR